jgi:hypothetical protein
MIETLALIILFVSFLGMLVIAVSKIPVLREVKVSKKSKASFFVMAQQKVGKAASGPRQLLNSSFWNVFLQRVLSKIKILSLKIEAKCNQLLAGTRAKNRKQKEDEKYWEKMSNTKSKKKK